MGETLYLRYMVSIDHPFISLGIWPTLESAQADTVRMSGECQDNNPLVWVYDPEIGSDGAYVSAGAETGVTYVIEPVHYWG
jgi:hypothetical protein